MHAGGATVLHLDGTRESAGRFARVGNQVYFCHSGLQSRTEILGEGWGMNRRDFLRSAGLVSAGLTFWDARDLFARDAPAADWRTFEVITRVEVLKYSGTTRIWVPAALIEETSFQKTLSNYFDVEGGTAKLVDGSKADSLGIITADYAAGVKPVITVTSRISTRNCAVDFSTPGRAPKENPAELEHFLRPTKLLPTDGIVKTT